MDYEQPTSYIVESTDYRDEYETPVLTAGKSFILGHTNETSGIYSNVPVIIFDDFTTDSRLVDFPFKVKSSAMKILQVRQGINIQYVAYFMSITRLVGDTHKRYWISEYSKLSIPLPPLAEQRRIVAEVEKWFALIDDLEANKQDLQGAIRQVRAKVLDLAIHGKLVPQDPADEPAIALLRRINPHYTPSDTSHYQNIPFDIPASWEWVRLDDVLTIMNGYAFKSSKYISNGGVRIIRITNVQDGYVCDDSPLFYPTALVNEYSSFLLKEGDLLMSLTGNVGRVGLLQREMLPAALNQRVACLREKQPWGYLRYIFYLLRTTFFLNACVASGNATAQLNISTGWLKGFLFPLPPLAEQKRIVSEIERIFGVLGTIEENIR